MVKLKIGERAVIRSDNKRTPKWIRDKMRLNNPRTIQVVFYNKKQQHNLYYFNSNGKGNIDISYIPFRATQLKLYEKGAVGRPKEKRIYTKRGL